MQETDYEELARRHKEFEGMGGAEAIIRDIWHKAQKKYPELVTELRGKFPYLRILPVKSFSSGTQHPYYEYTVYGGPYHVGYCLIDSFRDEPFYKYKYDFIEKEKLRIFEGGKMRVDNRGKTLLVSVTNPYNEPTNKLETIDVYFNESRLIEICDEEAKITELSVKFHF